MLNPQLRHQSLARPLTDHEVDFAAALEAAFAAGKQTPADIAAALTAAAIVRPGASDTMWTADTLVSTLASLNASLDQAYADHGIGA